MIQMPLVHVMAHVLSDGNSSDTTPVPNHESFLAKLTALMQDDASRQPHEESGDALEHMEQIIAELMAFLADDAPVDDTGHIAQVIAAFMSATVQSSSEPQQQSVAQANLQQWLQQADRLIQGNPLTQHLDVQTPSPHQQETNAQHGRIVVQTDGEAMIQHKEVQFTHIQKVIASILELAQQPANNPNVDQHARALKDIIRTMLVSNGLVSQQHDVVSNVGQALHERHLAQLRSTDMIMQLDQRVATLNTTVTTSGLNSEASIQHTATLDGARHVTAQQLFPMNMSLQSGHHAQTLVGQEAPAVQMNSEAANEQALVMPLSQQARATGSDQQLAQPFTAMQAQHFAEEVTPFVIKQLRFAQLNGVSEARIALIPEHLGHINIHIAMKNGQMVAQFIAESAMGKEMLEGQLTQLRTMLQGQGIQVEKLEVLQGQQMNLFQQQRERHEGQSFHSDSNKNRKPSYEALNDDFSIDFNEDAMPNSRIYGSTFEAVI